MEGARGAYNIVAALQLQGELDAGALEKALCDVSARHESLRTIFVEEDGKPYQLILAPDQSRPRFTQEDVTEADLPTRLAGGAGIAFDLNRESPVRAWLFRLAATHHVLLLVVHHIAADGWSMGPLVRDLTLAYESRLRGQSPSFAVLPVQYADYSLWQRNLLGEEGHSESLLSKQLDFWQRALAGAPQELSLPANHPRPAALTYRGGAAPIRLSREVHCGLIDLSRSSGSTLFMVLQAGLAALLARLGAGEDIPIGTPVAGRGEPALEQLIGFFVNTLVLRTDVSGDPSFVELLRRVKAFDLEAYGNLDVPFERVVEALDPQRSLSRHPLFQVMLALQNTPRVALRMPGLTVHPQPLASGVAKFDLTFAMWERRGPSGEAEGIEGSLEYSLDLFEPETAEAISGYYQQLLAGVVARPWAPLHQLELVTATERSKLLDGFCGKSSALPDGTLASLFQEHVERDPHAIAVESGETVLTYGELNARANRLARHLRAAGVQRGKLVALPLERGAGMVIAMLAIVKAGAGYLPLDPAYPRQRVDAMLAESGARLYDFEGASADESNLDEWAGAEDLAYVMYTSGSTGTPKGIGIPQKAIIRLVRDCGYVNLRPGDRIAQVANASFDAATFEIWGALLNGGTIVVLPRETTLSPEAMGQALRDRKIDTLFLTTALFNQIARVAPRPFSTIRDFLFGGVAVDAAFVRAVLTHGAPRRLLHVYGPTENTTFSTWRLVESADGETVPIGGSVGNSRIHVLDDWLEPVPVGVPGELYVSGAGLAWGYRRQPARTAERFVANPWGEHAGERMYRTGDRVRWLADGALEFLGRVDQQVKIRGFRIEPGEIEAAIRDLPGVEQAAVMVRESGVGCKVLVAYAKAAGEARLDEAALRKRLSERLPEYMVPSVYVILDEMPLTANGKLDRKSLPAPELPTSGFRGARTPEEEILCGIFCEVLKVKRVGLDDNFFRLGGHSLLATRVVSRIRATLGLELPIRALFEAATVAELAVRLRGGAGARTPLIAQPRPARILLSYAQQRLWFLHRMEGPSGVYNIPAALRLEGELDVNALENALADVAARHETLRTIFVEEEGTPYQEILSPEIGRPGLIKEEIDESALPARLAEAANAAFDLGREAPMRAWLFQLQPRLHVLLLVVHHIAADGWSMGPLAHDLTTAWRARQQGRTPSFAPLPLQYADYTLWQRRHLGEESDPHSLVSKQLKFWREALEGAPEELSLPLDRPRPAVAGYQGGAVPVRVDPEIHRGLLEIARVSGASLFMVLQAGFAALLARLGAGEDIPIGSPIAGRGETSVEGLIGFFINTLVLRTDVSGDPDFLQLVQRVRTFDLEAYGQQDAPFERVVEALSPGRSLARHPLFQVMLSLQNTPGGELAMPGLVLRPEPLPLNVAKFDLTVGMWEQRDAAGEAAGIAGALEYSQALFDRVTAENIARWYERLLAEVVAKPSVPLHRLELATGAERRTLLEDFNGPCGAKPAGTLAGLFEEQVLRDAGAVAVECVGDRITYGELNARANRLARHLRTLGLRRGGLAALRLERGIDMVVAMLAIVKAGGAYLSVDLSYPRQWVDAMLAGSGATLYDFAGAPAAELGTDNLDLLSGPSDLAYVMYTSGSTGTPKGIGIPQEAIVRLVRDCGYVALGPRDRIAQVANASFDAATFEIWGALLNGGTAVILPRETTLSPEAMGNALRASRIDTLFLTTALFNQIAREAPESFSGLRDLLFGGEAVDPSCVREVLERGAPKRLLHVYGPTENTTFSTWHLVEQAGKGTVPIGGPVGNTRIYVLDAWLEPVPAGITGELYVAGAGLARGYQNQPAQTAERFVADPHCAQPGARMYRTGDLVRWSSGGAIEFIGRADQQVKIRGFRIEPGEIEAALQSHAEVQKAVVLVHDAGPGGKQLVAYVQTAAGAKLDPSSLSEWLGERLPDYMVPDLYVRLDEMPLTPNGKLDRKALPAPERRAAGNRGPRTPEEQILCGIFGEVLKLSRVGIDDNFFRLGGHSLLATRLVSRVRSALGIDLPIRALFEAPTVADLATRLRGAVRQSTSLRRQKRPERIPLSYAQQRLWFIDRLEGASCEYNMPEALRLKGELNRGAIERAIQTIVDRHESLRTHFAEEDGQPMQVIDDDLRIETQFEDLSGLEPAARSRAVAVALRREWEQPFALDRGPMLRVRLLKVGAAEHILLRTCHHVVSDGWSVGVFNREFELLYEAYSQGLANPLAPLAVQYADFALWQQERLQGESLQQGLEYWKRELADLPSRLDLPLDHPRAAHPDYAADACVVSLSAEQVAALRNFGQQDGATLYMALLAALALLLGRYSGQQDIALGSPIANRRETQLEELIGFFVNTLVMRVKLEPQSSFRELLSAVRRTTLDAYQHQDIPFERLVEELCPERSMNSTPLFQVMFAVQNAPMGASRLAGIEISPVKGEELRVRFDIEVHAFERNDGLDIVWVYNRGLFDRWRIQQMAGHHVQLLESALTQPDTEVWKLPMLRASELQLVLDGFGGARGAAPSDSVKELFERQAAQTPDAVAAVAGSLTVTYRELNERANRLAHGLIALGVQRETLVGLCLERSVEMLAAVVGIVKAGGAYVPIDSDLPHRRLTQLIADARLRHVVTSSPHRTLLQGVQHAVTFSDVSQQPSHNPAVATTSEQAVYVNYTSGSTGQAKGVLVPGRAVVRLVVAVPHEYKGRGADYVDLDASATLLQFAPLSFDAATFEIWGALLNGGTLVLMPPGLATADEIGEAIVKHGVNTLWLTAGLFNQVVDHALPALAGVRQLLAGGDVLSVEHVRKVVETHPNCHVINGYGPTENTTFSCCYRVPACADFSRSIPIGSPIRNTRAYVLDAGLAPAPAGVTGELYVAGAGLARGYLNRPAATAEAFVADPFAPEPGSRMYRTGDIVRWRPDGNLDFLGRADHQVKIRGFRVEPGEIETIMKAHPRVHDALVKLHDVGGHKQLLGYFIPRAVATVDQETRLRQIESWRELYESTYGADADRRDAAFDIVGWNSSYTGQAIPAAEMRIWLEETLARLTVLGATRVLEIGCGTGMLLTALAPRCERYIGLDFSEEALHRLGRHVAAREDLRHVELRRGLAHELAFLPNDSLDLVILNSTIQYFPDVDYLLQVLAEAVRVTTPGGHIFAGDLRNLHLLDAYHASVQLHKSAHSTSVDELRRLVEQSRRREEELLIAPALFEDLARRWDKLGRAEASLKSGAYDNELSRFRYDVLMTMGPCEEAEPPDRWIDWDAAGDWRKGVAEALAGGLGLSIGVRGIRDARTSASVQAARLIEDRESSVKTVEELLQAATALPAEDPDSVMRLARESAAGISWRGFGADGIYDAVFQPHWRAAERLAHAPAPHYHRLANVPTRALVEDDLGHLLQNYLRERLPEYMAPASLTALPAWPLTPNGKVDRRALPVPVPFASRDGGYRAPRTPHEEILCALFAESLSLVRVGIDDNFFDLGGHSLLAMRLVSRIRAALGIPAAIQMLFEAPTVRALADRLGVETSPETAFQRVLRLRTTGHLPPLFCIHPGGGLSWCYAGLIREIRQRPIFGIQASGIAADEPLPTTIDEMAGDYLGAIRTLQPAGPYSLLGGSFGGLVAHAIACKLQERGDEVALLAMLDSYPPEGAADMPLPGDEQLLGYIAQHIGIKLADLGGAPLELSTLLERAGHGEDALSAVDVEHMRRMVEVWKHHYRLCWSFRRAIFRGDLLLFIATREKHLLTPKSWAEYVSGEIRVRPVDCNHNEIVQPLHMAVIGRLLEQYLQGETL